MKTGQPHAEVKSRRLLKVAFLLSSLFLSRAQDVIGPSCLASSPAGGQRRVTFLRQDAAGVRVLYLTLWSEDLRLVTCEVNSSPLVTQTYLSLCERSDSWGQEINHGLNISLLLASDSPCVSSTVPKFARERDGAARKTRRKRSWILPGTLWCGSGSKAGGYEQLGMFENADRCCREHDYCQHIIRAFTVNYGVFNSNLFTVSHCECDQRFRQCLLGSNDTISSMVGYSFFNILRIPCFELKQLKRCTEFYWWGMCKAAKEAPYAVFKPPLPYNTSNVISKYGHTNKDKLPSSEGQHGVKRPNPQRKSPKTDHRCLLRDPPRGDTFYGRRKKGRGCKRRQKLDATSQMPTAPTKTTLLNSSKSSLLSNRSNAGKNKSIRKGFLDHTTQNREDIPHVPTISDPQTLATTPTSAPPSTQKPKLQLHPRTAITRVTKPTQSKPNFPKQTRCCGSRMPVGGDTLKADCKSCQEQETDTNGSSITQTASDFLLLKETSRTSEQKTLEMLGNMAALPAPVTTKRRTSASRHVDGKTHKQVYSHLLWNSTGQEHMGSTITKNIQAQRASKQNREMHNVTDNQLLCGSLKHLDECEFKIPPLEKKYNLHNTESKTAYHCDCTSRLAVQIANFKQPGILSALLVDFVSQQCFSLSKKKKCHNKKRCSRGFTKASDLHQALKKREEKESAGVRIPGNARKRRIPVSLYKRCLRLGRRADVMEQLG